MAGEGCLISMDSPDFPAGLAKLIISSRCDKMKERGRKKATYYAFIYPSSKKPERRHPTAKKARSSVISAAWKLAFRDSGIKIHLGRGRVALFGWLISDLFLGLVRFGLYSSREGRKLGDGSGERGISTIYLPIAEKNESKMAAPI